MDVKKMSIKTVIIVCIFFVCIPYVTCINHKVDKHKRAESIYVLLSF